jgi:6-phosphogluconolactonase
MMLPEIQVLPDSAALARAAAERVSKIAHAAVAEKGYFSLVLAGGSTPKGLYRALAEPAFHERIPWAKTQLYFGDERCVPPDHADSNYRMAREVLLSKISLATSNVVRMPGERLPEEGAAIYESTLRQNFGLRGDQWPSFDLILLGLGDDGHTASLFPGMPALAETRRLVVASDVPGYVSPQVQRLTLTFPVLNAARHVMFLVAGEAKSEAVAAVLADSGPEYSSPASQVRPRTGQTIWFLDRAAAAVLNDAG